MSSKKPPPWEQIRQDSRSARRKLESISKAIASTKETSSPSAISAVSCLNEELKEWRMAFEEFEQKAAQTLEESRNDADAQIDSFNQNLVRAIRESGHEVFGETSPLIMDGVVHIKTDPSSAAVKINGATYRGLPYEEAARAAIDEAERLKKLKYPDNKFLPDLLRAYERELKSRGKPDGSQVETSAILLQMALLRQNPSFFSSPSSKNFREYPLELFRADLQALLKSSGGQITAGRKFKYSSGADTKGAVFMLIPGLGRTGYLGRIWFEHAGGGE